MKLYWHRGNIPGFFIGIFLLCICLYVFITGKSGGIIFHSSGLEAYLNAGMFLLIALYLMSSILWDKKDKDTKIWEFALIILYAGMCEIIPHILVRYLGR